MKKVETSKATYYIRELVDTFSTRRIYYITDVKGRVGGHAHRYEDEIFVMVKGSCMAKISDGKKIENVELKEGGSINSPRMNWHEFYEFSSEDAILLAISTINFDPERKGYIEDFDEFIKEALL